MVSFFPLAGPLLLAASAGPLFAAPAPLSPRLAYAKELAGQERRQAEALLQVEESSATRAALEKAVLRARSWETALSEAAPGAGPQDGDLVVAGVRGAALLLRAGKTMALARGMLLREADQLVMEQGQAELRFHDGTSLTLRPESSLRVLQAPRTSPPQASFTLERGGLYWDCRSFALATARVMSPRSIAQLKNGRASLFVDEEGNLRLSVFEGAVELAARPTPSDPAAGGPWEDIYN